MKEIMTVQEVADYLQVKITTIRKHIKSGELKAFKKLGKYFVTSENLKEFITKEN